jgi:hypothetical protein
MSEDHIQFIVPDRGSLDTAGLAFLEAVRKGIAPAKGVELAVVAYHWSEQMKKNLSGGGDELWQYPSLEQLRTFLGQYVKWRDENDGS